MLIKRNMEKFSVGADSYHLLNDNEVPFASRLKLCRVLWISNEFVLARKYQLLLNWLGTQLTSLVSNSSDFTAAIHTFKDFLTSKCLVEELPDLKTVTVKPAVTQTISEYLQNQDNNFGDMRECLRSIGEILLTNDKIICNISSQFEALSAYTSTWINFVKLQMKNSTNHTELNDFLDHVRFLLEKNLKLMKGYNANKKSLMPFCKHLLLPVLELHCDCTNIEKTEHDVIATLLSVLEKTILTALFSEENRKIYDDLISDEFGTKNDVETDETRRRSKKFQRSKRLNLVMGVLQNISQKEQTDGKVGENCITLFFKLFLIYAKVKSEVKIKMLKELTNIACVHQTKCRDITSCDKLNIALLCGLLKMADLYRLYQPAVDKNLSEDLLQWMKKITESLVTNYKPCCQWLSCMMVTAEIDKSIVEPWMKSIIIKSVSKDSSNTIPLKNIFEMVDCFVDVYIKIRQSVRLVNIVILVLESAVEYNTSQNIDTKRLINIAEEFGNCLGKMFASKLSPSLVIEIWSTILVRISQKVEEISKNPVEGYNENTQSSTLGFLNMLFKLLHKVVSKTPIFTLWNHLTVREKFKENISSLKSSRKALQEMVLKNTISEKLIGNFLSATLIETQLSNALEKYVVVESDEVLPGIQNVLYNKNNDKTTFASSSLFTDDFPLIEFSALSTNDPKLNFVLLILIKIQKLTQNHNVIEISQKSKKLTLVENADAVCDALNDLLKQLETYLQSINTGKLSQSGGILIPVFKHVVDFSPVLLNHKVIRKWMINAAVSLMFCNLTWSDDCKTLLEKAFDFFPDSSQDGISFLVLKIAAKRLSEYIPNKMLPPFTSPPPKMDPAKMVTGILQNKKLLKIDSFDEVKIVFQGIEKYMQILRKVNIESLSLEETMPVFGHLLSCSKILENIVKKYCEMASTDDFSIFKQLISFILKIVGIKRIDLLQCCEPVEILKYFIGIKELVDNDLQDSLNALLQETIFTCYHNSSTNARAILKTFSKAADNDVSMELISVQIRALISLLSFDDGDFLYGKKFQSGCRKRKMRNEIQICKKLKLDSSVEGNDFSPKILSDDLNSLYQEVCQVFNKRRKDLSKSHFAVLSSCIDAYNLLISHENQYQVSIDDNVVEIFKSNVNIGTDDSKNQAFIAKLHFLGSCLQLKEVEYTYDKSHILNLVKYFGKDCQNAHFQHALKRCILCFLWKTPLQYIQKDVFDEVILNLRCGDDENIKSNIKFASLLLDSGLLNETGQDDDQKVSRIISSRFVKSLLESLNVYSTKVSLDINTMNVTTLISANQIVTKIVKIKWVRLQAIEICNIFDAIFGIPLEKIHELKGANVMYEAFHSCYDVIHCIIIHHKDIGHLAAICNSAFRKMLKAALHLGKQKSDSIIDSSELLHDNENYNKSIKCAGLLEKLFQLVADNYKKDFLKCMSYVVADYICITTSDTIVPFVKKFFTRAIYHLISVMDEFDVAMIRKALPAGVRDVFQTLYIDYGRNFKYKGFV
uniref:uncharacterized protein LOC120332083 isoform X1 n=1 Tax=Styela clava TaxID=7725 RepID=UPI00193A8687|nr:uncharacterized protein LOC120332083 isoform X1 [Styela clava]